MGSSKEKKVRLDQLLLQKNLAETREKAKAMIMAGVVEVDRIRVDKPGHPVSASAGITVKEAFPPYVSRGGVKLKAALDHFCVDVTGKIILDVGSSTGGFTDCLIQSGARKVIAVDVGYGQLHWKLRNDPRVVVVEKTNIRYLQPGDIPGPVDGATIDVSFISLRLVVPAVSRHLGELPFIIALLKPQFEVGKGQVGKGGVVKDPRLHERVVSELGEFFESLGWSVGGCIASPILGPKGNKEFLMYLTR
jgi:23S rRNA (cytidine1920-2'-O)/16S rRNA (cytidine1409-2'-O)-methyltransferase